MYINVCMNKYFHCLCERENKEKIFIKFNIFVHIFSISFFMDI